MSVTWTDESERPHQPAQPKREPALSDLFPPNPPSSPRPSLDGNLRRGPKLEPNDYGPTLPLGLIARTTDPFDRNRLNRWTVRALLFAAVVFTSYLIRLWMGG